MVSFKTKSGRIIEVPSVEEDAVINDGIADDNDTFELTDDWFDTADLKINGKLVRQGRARNLVSTKPDGNMK